ncbi:hypothetical protein D047_2131B, partial [Vibrio parahaemolyticus VPTS-2010_2]
CLFVF